LEVLLLDLDGHAKIRHSGLDPESSSFESIEFTSILDQIRSGGNQKAGFLIATPFEGANARGQR